MRKSNKNEKLKTLENKPKQKLKKTTQELSSLIFLGLASYSYVNNPDFFQTKDENVSCRIGITMDLERQKKEWTRYYLEREKVIKKGTILSIHQSKEAKKQNCETHPGGRGSEKAIWYVYKFEY